MQLDLLASFAQFGAAGLIGFMWLTERRFASERERMLVASHDRMLEQKLQLEQLMRVVSENTRAMTRLEASQRSLADALARLPLNEDAPAQPQGAAA